MKSSNDTQQHADTFDWFLRILDGQTLTYIARTYAVGTEMVRQRVSKLARRLSHPSMAVSGEVPPSREEQALLPTLLRTHKAFYLARLHSYGEIVGIRPTMTDKEPPALHVPVWTPGLEAKLGTMSDAGLAAQLGASTEVVRRRRLELGVKSFVCSNASSHVAEHAHFKWSSKIISLNSAILTNLAIVCRNHDYEIARIFG